MVRRLAVDALQRMESGRCLAQEAINSLLAKHHLTPENRSFLWELVHGVTRQRDTLDRIIATFSRVKLKKIHPQVLHSLRIAVYQMVYLDRVPAGAAVSESVEIIKSTFPIWIVKFLNGCLRAVSRSIDIKVGGRLSPKDLRRAVPISGQRSCLFTEDIFPDPEEDPAGHLSLRFSHPEWLVRHWLDRFGKETVKDILRAGNQPPSLWLRPSPGRFADLARELERRGIQFETENRPPEGIRLLEPVGRVMELPGFRQGWFVVQDRTAMLSVPFLGPRPGERVLDVCAAPGGKATHLAQLVGPEGTVVAVDRDAKRLRLLDETCVRLGLTNIAAVTADALAADLDLGEPFDRVLVDVPCSNTGVLSKRVEVRHRVGPDLIRSLVPVQRNLLLAGLRQLRPGGTLLYSTCALIDDENGALVESVLGEGIELEDEKEILPREGHSDGGYLARLARAR